MKKIKLTKGFETIVDDEDFEYLNQFKWHFAHGYASTCIPGMKGKHQYLHNMILGVGSSVCVDHINRNGIDNRRDNIRVADKRINSINRDVQSNNTSGYKGVSWHKKMKKWEVYIWNMRKKILLGYFEDIKQAVKIRQRAEKIYHAI